jgi:hypothetical protein
MNRRDTSVSMLDGASALLVGAGVITMALFPLALPIIVLTAVAVLPLLLLPLALGLVVAAVALPVLCVRALWRRVRASRRRQPITLRLNFRGDRSVCR